MKKNKLGLPLEYGKLSEYYDALSIGDHISKNRVIEKILRKHNVKTVLDLSCGTGCQVFWLAKRGFKVTGVDFSPALLKIARNKAQKEKITVKLIKGDMRTIKVGQFDAVITIFNAIGHLTKTDFAKAIKNVHRNLKEGGLYVFDIINLQAMTNKAVIDLTADSRKTVKNTKIHHIQHSKINKKNGCLTSYDYFAIQKGSAKPKILKEKFTLQIYTAKQLREMLTKNGFKILNQYGIDGSKFIARKTTNILTVAKKTVKST